MRAARVASDFSAFFETGIDMRTVCMYPLTYSLSVSVQTTLGPILREAQTGEKRMTSEWWKFQEAQLALQAGLSKEEEGRVTLATLDSRKPSSSFRERFAHALVSAGLMLDAEVVLKVRQGSGPLPPGDLVRGV
jgi:hypothetical protein